MHFQDDSLGCITFKLRHTALFAVVVICSVAVFRYESTTLRVHDALLEVKNVTIPFKPHSLRSGQVVPYQHVRDGSIHKAESLLAASYDDIETAVKKLHENEIDTAVKLLHTDEIDTAGQLHTDGNDTAVKHLHTDEIDALGKQLHNDKLENLAIPIRQEGIAIDTKEWMLSYFSRKKCRKSRSDYQPPSWLKQMFILIGVQKGGTKAIHTFLEENPQFVARCDEQVSTKELFFFNNITDSDKMKYIDQGALQANYSNLIENKCPVATASLVNDSKKMYLDDTPMYIQDSHLIPQFLNCVMPTTKIMAVLRNPTERAFSHYNFYLERGWCRAKSFDEWVDVNIQELNQSGVLTVNNSVEELLAWERYNDDPFYRNSRRCKTFVTRGMYAIQLLHYLTALDAAGRPRSDFHVIRSEDIQGSTRQQEYDKILSFLDLPPHTLQKRNSTLHKTEYKSSMNAASREKLDAFFRPYNQRLYELLDWDPVWG